MHPHLASGNTIHADLRHGELVSTDNKTEDAFTAAKLVSWLKLKHLESSYKVQNCGDSSLPLLRVKATME